MSDSALSFLAEPSPWMFAGRAVAGFMGKAGLGRVEWEGFGKQRGEENVPRGETGRRAVLEVEGTPKGVNSASEPWARHWKVGP